jgi:hypothetical protein
VKKKVKGRPGKQNFWASGQDPLMGDSGHMILAIGWSLICDLLWARWSLHNRLHTQMMKNKTAMPPRLS